MATIGVSEAARMVGRDVSTLHRMMKSGRLSYTTDSSGRRRLDPAELARLFEISSMHGNGATQSMDSPQAQSGDAMQVEALLRDAVQSRDAMLADLRRRLDASEAERRQLSERLQGLLTGNRPDDAASRTWPRRVLAWLRAAPGFYVRGKG
jgi:predicted site-specific integrase-resolvase